MATDSNRPILEVLKMCIPSSVLKELSLVNKHWTAASFSHELWFALLDDLHLPYDPECELRDSFLVASTSLYASKAHPMFTWAAYERQQQTVVSLYEDHMVVFNKEGRTKRTTRLSTEIKVYQYAYAMLMDGSLCCCGGFCYEHGCIAMSTVLLITSQGEISYKPEMITARYDHGVVAYGQRLSAFGGLTYSEPVLHNEMFTGSVWSPLPDLHAPRVNCVPCIHKGLIYLCNGGNSTVEVLNPESISLDLLPGVEVEDMSGLAVVYEDSLILIRETTMWRWNFETKAKKVTIKPRSEVRSWVRTVLDGDFLYAVDRGYWLVMINMKTLESQLIDCS